MLPEASWRIRPARDSDARNSLKGYYHALYIHPVLIGAKLKELRQGKNLSQGDIEHRTGLLRCYTSRVENGHTIPSLETLEKYAHALQVPLYKLFHDAKSPPKSPHLRVARAEAPLWGATGHQLRELRKFATVLSRLNDRQRKLLLEVARRMARRSAVK